MLVERKGVELSERILARTNRGTTSTIHFERRARARARNILRPGSGFHRKNGGLLTVLSVFFRSQARSGSPPSDKTVLM